MEIALAFVLGLSVGSFLNSLLWRLEKGEVGTIFTGRSKCVHCRYRLGFWDLIPILSFVFLKGRCRYCAKKISWQYPLVEIASGLALLLIYKYSSGAPESIFLAGVFLTTFAVFIYDLKFFIIPDPLILAGIAWLALWKIFFFKGEWANYFLVGVAVFVFFFLIYWFSRGTWMGGGDSKLGFMLVFWLGWPAGVWGMFFASLLGALVGLGLIIFKKATAKSKLPFGPFMITGAWIAWAWGVQILEWYEGLFF